MGGDLEGRTDRQTDRQTDTRMNRGMAGDLDGQMDRQTPGWLGTWRDGQTDRQTPGWMGTWGPGQMDRRTDRHPDEQRDGWGPGRTDGRTDRRIPPPPLSHPPPARGSPLGSRRAKRQRLKRRHRTRLPRRRPTPGRRNGDGGGCGDRERRGPPPYSPISAGMTCHVTAGGVRGGGRARHVIQAGGSAILHPEGSSVTMDLLTALGCAVAVLLVTMTLALLGLAHRLGLLYQLFHKVEPKSPRHGGELVADVLKAHGVRFVFALAGGHISPILVAAEKVGIRVVDTRHEATAVFAADAVSRLSGRIGVAAVTAGPGVTNAVTAIKNAQMAESPLLLIGGAAASLQKGRGALQDIDQLSLFRTLCKACVSVRTVRQIVPALRRAIVTAQSGTPGPVFVELPIDVLYPFHVVEKEVGGPKSARGLRGKLIQWYLQNYVRNLFAGAWESQDVTPLPVKVPLATEDEVQRCAELVSRSTKPLVLVGSQAMLPPTPSEELREALEALGIPCYLGGAARGLLPPKSPLLLRHNRRDALRDADLVLLAGTVCDFRLSYGRLFGRGAVIVAVNRDRVQLLCNADVFWRPKLAVQGDAASFVVGLARRLRGFSCPKEWLQGLQEAEQRKERANREKAATPTTQHLNPMDLLYRMDALLPPESLLVADGGDFVGTAAYIVRPRRPLSWLDPGAFGTLGVGGGFALGAKLCRPEAEVWIIYGDGSLGYSLVEFDTFVRHKTPVIALVGNDACWSQIAREQVAMLGSNVACGLEFVDYHAAAEALGGKGFVVDQADREQLDAVLRSAQDECRQGRPVLINALIGKTDFRQGSISV